MQALMDIPDVMAAPFRWGAALRRRRLFHPNGVLASGFLERVAPPQEGLPVSSSDIVARISKAAGTPGALPDATGLALRLPAGQDFDGPWDILLASAGSGVLSRAIGLRPVASWGALTMTSLMPLHYRASTWWLRAQLITTINGYGLSLDNIRNQIGRHEVRFQLDQACGTADFRPLAQATLNQVVMDDDVSFDPVLNTAPGVELRPRWLTELRALAYRGSRDGRDAA